MAGLFARRAGLGTLVTESGALKAPPCTLPGTAAARKRLRRLDPMAGRPRRHVARSRRSFDAPAASSPNGDRRRARAGRVRGGARAQVVRRTDDQHDARSIFSHLPHLLVRLAARRQAPGAAAERAGAGFGTSPDRAQRASSGPTYDRQPQSPTPRWAAAGHSSRRSRACSRRRRGGVGSSTLPAVRAVSGDYGVPDRIVTAPRGRRRVPRETRLRMNPSRRC